jgi:hypothetical protein
MKLEILKTGILLALLMGVAACGKYGAPMRTGETARGPKPASTPTLTPASGPTSEAECPPDQKPKLTEARAEPR